jgi:hypothetical protein
MWHTKTIAFISVLICLVIFFSRCLNDASAKSNDPRGSAYAGGQSCVSCHKNIYQSYVHNNHYKTSAPVSQDSLGKITAQHRPFHFSDSAWVEIKNEHDSFFQSYVVNNKEVIAAPFDIAFGSGEKAQTYAYWKEGRLQQLPLTYYFDTLRTWANSPGFPASRARFNRVIDSRCFECHASYVSKEMLQSGSLSVEEKLDKNTIVYGIDCERCHGPALEHARFQQENPAVKASRFITSIKSLSRQQQLDICAVCHSGNDQSTQRSLFAFMPGDTLSQFYYPDFGSGKPEPDVHGKQMQMLQMSKCFIHSQMTCNTCHATHENGVANTESFIAKCMGCHQNSDHARQSLEAPKQKANRTIYKYLNCIDCHMPLEESKVISFGLGTEQRVIPYYLRRHWIK